MSVFKKKTDIFTPENKKIRIAKTKTPKCRTQKKPSEGVSMSRHVKNIFVTAENGLPVKYNKGKKENIFHLFSDRDSKMNPFIRRIYGSD